MSVTSRSLHVEGGRVSTEHRKIGCAGVGVTMQQMKWWVLGMQVICKRK